QRVCEIVRIIRKRVEIFALQYDCALVCVGVHAQRCVAGRDLHLLLFNRGSKLDVRDRSLCRIDLDRLLLEKRKPSCEDTKKIRARGDSVEDVNALFVCGGGLLFVVRIDQSHHGAGYRASKLVCDLTAERGLCLCGCDVTAQYERKREGDGLRNNRACSVHQCSRLVCLLQPSSSTNRREGLCLSLCSSC